MREVLVTCFRCESTDWKMIMEEKCMIHIRCANCNDLYDTIHWREDYAEKEENSE